MEPRPPAAEPEPPLPRGPGPGLELEPGLWAPEAAEPAPGPPPWSPLEEGECPAAEGPAEPLARREEEEEEEPRLRPVFDALDRDGDGFVRVEEFVQFATAYGAEQVRPGPTPGPGEACGALPGPGPPLAPQAQGSCQRGSVAPRGRSCGCEARQWLPMAVGVTQQGSAMPGLWWSPKGPPPLKG